MPPKSKTPEAEKLAQMIEYTDRIKAARTYVAECVVKVEERSEAFKKVKAQLAVATTQLLREIDDDEPRLPFAEDSHG